MKLRVFSALAVVAFLCSPATANELSPYGVWGEGSQLKKQRPYGGFNAAPQPFFESQRLGFPPRRSKAVDLAGGGPRPEIAAEEPGVVALDAGYAPGEIIIDTSARTLYYMVADKQAYAYPIAVGKKGFTWTGTETVSKIVDWPDWLPPGEMRDRMPSLPVRMTGGVKNPLGAKAIYLGNTLYRIHGTNDSESIGEAASSGCFRMLNGHVVHLATLVQPGTVVHVLNKMTVAPPVAAPEPAPEALPEPEQVPEAIPGANNAT